MQMLKENSVDSSLAQVLFYLKIIIKICACIVLWLCRW